MAKDPKAEAAPEAPAKSSKKLIIIIAAAVLLAGGGAGAWFMMKPKAGAHKEEVKHAEPAKAPVFMTLETFTLNLQPDPDEKFLQLDMQLQVASNEAVETLKTQMPVVRNRLILLLTSKKASDILTMEGKKQLSDEIITELKKPFSEGAKPQEILGVYFTSLIVQ
jgi:flagellar FliL protein